MFTERLDHLLEILHASGTEIAKYAGFDRTNISRLRSGARVPESGSTTSSKLIRGIYLYADDRHLLKELCEAVGLNGIPSAEEIRAGISAWLFEGEEDRPKKPRASRSAEKQAKTRSFGKRLNAIMTMTDLSNVRLSRMLYTDTSLISRYRSGVRSPLSDPEKAKRLAEILWSRIVRKDMIKELAEIMQYPAEEIDDNAFSSWFLRDEELSGPRIRMAERFFADFDAMPEQQSAVLPPAESVLEEIGHSDGKTVYTGNEGLREAVLRFLADAVTEKYGELQLYSDQDMDWMTEDPSFAVKWAVLMAACARNRTKIRIIHSIDRGTSEMTAAIRFWLQLYMSGMIESYWCRQTKGERFSRTIFLAPGHACINAVHVIGTEREGLYRYDTDEVSLRFQEAEYRQLLSMSGPLLQINPQLKDDDSSGIYVIQNELSLATMPQDLATELLSEKTYAEWQIRHEELMQKLKTQKIYECIPLRSPQDLSDIRQSHYTPEQYRRHIQAMIELLKNEPNYYFIPLPEAPFHHIRITVSEHMNIVLHEDNPAVSFGIPHPLICRAFLDYAQELTEKNKKDRNTLIRLLREQYLSDSE